jgi:hypothetical protein
VRFPPSQPQSRFFFPKGRWTGRYYDATMRRNRVYARGLVYPGQMAAEGEMRVMDDTPIMRNIVGEREDCEHE